jgi:hypothetical protein
MHRATCLLIAISISLGTYPATASAQTCTPGTKGALVFDGVNDYVRVPHHSAMDNMANFTFEAWVKAAPTGPGVRALIEHGGGNPYLLAVTTNFFMFLDGILAVQGGPPMLDNIWHHFALTGAGNSVSLYVDGGLVAIGSYSSPLNASNGDLYIGASYGGGPFYDHWSGAIDDVRIWNVTRTQAQINNSRLYTLTGSELGLVAYYRFDTPGQTVVNSATSTGTTMDGILGPDGTANAEDPTYTTTAAAPMFYCGGTGQPNSTAARLQINGTGVGTSPGPFPVSVLGGQTLTLTWSGPANMPLALIAGPLNTANTFFGCAGSADIATPPFFADATFVFNGTVFPGSMFFVLSSAGTATQTFTIPQAAVGLGTTVQGLVIQPGGAGCPAVLTAAFALSIT